MIGLPCTQFGATYSGNDTWNRILRQGNASAFCPRGACSRSSSRVPNQQIRIAEFPFNREQCWEFAFRVRAKSTASLALHASYSATSRYPVRTDQGFIREAFLGSHKKVQCHFGHELLIPVH